MSRPLRIDKPGLFYHAMNRGNNKQQIFFDDSDYALFVSALFESCSTYNIVLHSFSLMPNHFHLFFHTTDANLSRFMQRLCTTFVIRYNIKHQRVGHLFQGRFKSQVVDSVAYACVLSRYIHLNPVNTSRYADSSIEDKAALLKNWRWSSLYYYCNPSAAAAIPCLDTREILSHFGTQSDQQISQYARYIEQGLACSADDVRNAVFDALVEQSIIGSDDFVNTITALIDGPLADHPLSGKLLSVPLQTVETSYLSLPGITYADLHARGRGRTAVRDLAIASSARSAVSKVTLTEIGLYFGGLTVSSVSKIEQASKRRFATDGAYRNLVLAMEECLHTGSYDRIAMLDISCIRNDYG